MPLFPIWVANGGHQPKRALVSKLLQRHEWFGRSPRFKEYLHGRGFASYLGGKASFFDNPTFAPTLCLTTPPHATLYSNPFSRLQPKPHGAELASASPQRRRRRRGRHKRGGPATQRGSSSAARARPVRVQGKLGDNRLVSGTTVRSRGQRS